MGKKNQVTMRSISIHQPAQLIIGANSLGTLVEEIGLLSNRTIFLLTDPNVQQAVSEAFVPLEQKGNKVVMHLSSGNEPSFSDFDQIITKARSLQIDLVIGAGGGSVLDLAKLVAALLHSNEPIQTYVGNGRIKVRETRLICIPTTSGAGSESSPNAILIDEKDNSKKGIIDPALMPDAVYIDPVLISSLPPNVTAFTGLDALTHCIEAYANKFSHPMIDTYALEGIKLISKNLKTAIVNGKDLNAREKVALGSYYGGMCLGPVNTAAVHALAYPLGTKYKIAHGLSNALLLPFVLEFNLENAPEKYAEIALAMGGKDLGNPRDTAFQGIKLIRELIRDCEMPSSLAELNIPDDSVIEMAEDAMLIQRLLRNNVREVRLEDAIAIYQSAF